MTPEKDAMSLAIKIILIILVLFFCFREYAAMSKKSCEWKFRMKDEWLNEIVWMVCLILCLLFFWGMLYVSSMVIYELVIIGEKFHFRYGNNLLPPSTYCLLFI